jgi:hypothetical protein
MSAGIESKRMTYHNTPQLSWMDSANHYAAFPGLSALSTTTIHSSVVLQPEVLHPSMYRLYTALFTWKPRMERPSLLHAPRSSSCQLLTHFDQLLTSLYYLKKSVCDADLFEVLHFDFVFPESIQKFINVRSHYQSTNSAFIVQYTRLCVKISKKLQFKSLPKR